MKHLPLASLAFCLCVGGAAPAQAEDIMSILARNADGPAKLAPKTIPYSYRLELDITEYEGKEESSAQAVLRIDPTQAPGARAQIISATDPESDLLKDFLKELEDPENTLEAQAENFWCGDSEPPSEDETDIISDPSNIEVVYEDDTKAVLRPNIIKLAELMMQSDSDDADKDGEKMLKRLLKRIEGEITLAKPSGDMTGFSVRMTRSMTMMLVAKLKEMEVEQSCALAPNGHYHTSTLKMHVEGKALGSRFGQDIDMRVSELTPLP